MACEDGCCSCCPRGWWKVMGGLAIFFYVFHMYAQGGGIYYIAQYPTFDVSSVHLPLFHIDSEDRLTSMLHVNLTARNPNRLNNFEYEDFTVTASSNGTLVGDGLIPAFSHHTRDTNVLSFAVTSDAWMLSPEVASDLTNASRLLLEIDLESKLKVNSVLLETDQAGLEVHCKGIKVPVPRGKAHPPPFFPHAHCKTRFRFNIVLMLLQELWGFVQQILEAILEEVGDRHFE